VALSVCSFVHLLPETRSGLTAAATKAVTDISSPVKKIDPHEIYASGGSLLVEPINAPHLL